MTGLFDDQPGMRVRASPFELRPEDVREALELAKPDHGAYLATVAAARKGFADAEAALGGPVYLHEVVDEISPAGGYVKRFIFRRKQNDGQ